MTNEISSGWGDILNGEDKKSTRVGWRCDWERDEDVPPNCRWPLEGRGREWARSKESAGDDAEGTAGWRRRVRTRCWNPEAKPSRGRDRRPQARGRGKIDSASGLSNSRWQSNLDHDRTVAPTNCEFGVPKQEDDDATAEMVFKSEFDGAEFSGTEMDVDQRGRRDDVNADEVRGLDADHPDLENQARLLVKMIEQNKHTSQKQVQEHAIKYKRAKTEAAKQIEQRLDIEQKLCNVRGELGELRNAMHSAQVNLEIEKKRADRIPTLKAKISEFEKNEQRLVQENAELKNEVRRLLEQLESEKKSSSGWCEQLMKLQEENVEVTRKLTTEKEKATCQICMERPRDTCSLPCVHFNYCYQCLQKHHEKNRNCPACRCPTSGVLRCTLVDDAPS